MNNSSVGTAERHKRQHQPHAQPGAENALLALENELDQVSTTRRSIESAE
jgi:hypothetical protein